jgi:hypothetical protein
MRWYKVAAIQDYSLLDLLDLQEEGYDTVKWDATTTQDPRSRRLHNKTWPLEEFISNLSHEAPIFERSHIGSRARVIVTGPAPLRPVYVDRDGRH